MTAADLTSELKPSMVLNGSAAGRLFRPASPDVALDFVVPAELEAREPAEARGLARDQVRLLVSFLPDGRLAHARFSELPEFLDPGDLLVINTSGTLKAALPAWRADGTPLELRLSTRLPADLWLVELRTRPDEPGKGSRPFYGARPSERVRLPAGGTATLLTPYRQALRDDVRANVRLWVATLSLPLALHGYLETHGSPIRYSYVTQEWPAGAYQTVYATEPGSAEMPSAGRGFTPALLARLVARGVAIAPLLLHTGVASPECDEPAFEEIYRVPLETARAVNQAHAVGRRVIAVGTTVVRALETVADEEGTAHPGEGWTGLAIGGRRGLRAVDGLLTGFHEPRASHLAILEALAGREHLRLAYREALRERYLWHEFGDLHLILPPAAPRRSAGDRQAINHLQP